MKESDISRLVQCALTQEGARVFRNETGGYRSPSGIWVSYGLCKGSSDLIGWYKGRFLAVEIKTNKGRVTKQQQNFIDQVNLSGGIAFVARSPEEAVTLLKSQK